MSKQAPTTTATRDSLIPHLRSSLERSDFVSMVLSKYRGEEPDLHRIDVRLIELGGQPRLNLVFHYKTRDVTKNLGLSEGLDKIDALMGSEFRAGHLFTKDEEIEAQYSRKGRVRISSRKAGVQRKTGTTKHNRSKERLLDSSARFLRELGVTGSNESVLPSMSDKWKQINRFLEILVTALANARNMQGKPVRVVDFGAGKGYLTFAIHHYLRNTAQVDARVTGVELRPSLVELCNKVAARLACEGLSFVEGDVHRFVDFEADILVALHACDTATDIALYSGIRTGAKVLLASPCCHKQIRPQIQIPDVLSPMLRYGIHLEREAEMVTDTLRALLLEEAGYKVQVMEFVSSEHTHKNKLLVAVKRSDHVNPSGPRAAIDELKAFYGITNHHLETLLRESSHSSQ